MYAYGSILAGLEHRVRLSLARQVTDKARPDYGGFLPLGSGYPNADHTSSAHDLAAAAYVFMAEGSRLQGDDALFDSVLLAIEFQRRWQRPTGLIDLVSTNWESPPDTGFTVQLLSPVVDVARTKAAGGNERAARIAEELGDYVRSAAEGMVGRGFHTPNHRWVVCSGLSQAMALFPDLEARDYVESILAEGIDINSDGEFTERSTGVYNAVCDRSLRFMADHLDRPELLDHVRRNLDLMIDLFHADGSVETGISNRQDRGLRVVPTSIADSFFDMAQRDGNGVWATAADQLVALGEDNRHRAWLIQPFMTHPGYRDDKVKREPLPDGFCKYYPVSGLWRIKRGPLSATASARNNGLLSVRCGDVALRAVKFAGTYMGTAQLNGDAMEPHGDSGIRLIHKGENRRIPGYDLPLGREVPFGEFDKVRPTRERWTLPTMDLSCTIVEVDSGFDLRFQSEGGLDHVPFQIECCFDGPGQWETDTDLIAVDNGQTVFLKSDHGTFHSDDFGIRIGPGNYAHRMTAMQNSEVDNGSFRVLVGLQSPVDRIFEIRCGAWSLATQQIVQFDCC